MAQAPVLNALFNSIEKDAKLKGKIKVMAAAQGQDANNVKMWKGMYKVPFALVPDKDSKLGKALNFSPYPVSVVMDKSGKVLWVHIGSFESADEALKAIKKVVK